MPVHQTSLLARAFNYYHVHLYYYLSWNFPTLSVNACIPNATPFLNPTLLLHHLMTKIETQEIKDTAENQKDTLTEPEIVFASYAMKNAR